MTLEWIAQQVQDRERAQRALEVANQRLEAVGKMLKRASAADNLEQALAAVVQEVAKALGMGAALTLEGVRATSPGFEPGSDALYTLPLPGLEGKLGWSRPAPSQTRSGPFWRCWRLRWLGRWSRREPAAAICSPFTR